MLGDYQKDEILGALGEYRLEAEIGRGGQGVVYRAVQPRTGRIVAIKRIAGAATEFDDVRARFDREIRAAASFNHPNIVTVYGSEDVDGTLLMAMEYIEGKPLDRWAAGNDGTSSDSLGSTPRRAPDVLRLFTKICDAVAHAHQRGVIHRDLKPSNVLVDSRNEPHVVDFGLARALSPKCGEPNLTATAGFLGTPSYAAPEQFGDDDGIVDVRSDVYSVGAMLFHALTGRSWIGDHLTITDVVDALRFSDPPPPSSLRPGLSREVDAIVLKALERRKVDRYRSMDALGDDLRRFLEGQTVSAHPPSVVYKIGKFVRRHTLSVLMSIATVLALLALATVSAVHAASERELRQAAEDAMRTARAHARSAEREERSQRETAEFLMRLIEKIAETSYGRSDLPVRTVADWIVQPLKNQASYVRPDIRIRLHRRASDILYAVHDYDGANEQDLLAIELARQHVGPDTAEVADGLASLAANLNRQGKSVEAEARAREAVQIFDAIGANSALHRVTRYLGEALIGQNRADEAESVFARQVQAHDQANASPESRVASRLSLGETQQRLLKIEAAAGTLEEAMQIARNGNYENGPYALQVRQKLGELRFVGGDYEAAEALFQGVADQRLRTSGVKQFRTFDALRWHGLSLHALGRYADAERQFEQALRWALDSTPASGTEIARLRFARATALLAAGRSEEGQRLLAQAISRGTAESGADPKWSDQVQGAEQALRDNGWRIDASLRRRLGACAWIVDGFPGTAADKGLAIESQPDRSSQLENTGIENAAPR
ncbi:MAG: protein kinase [Phycisphaerales bacterium]|nr:protein kinase [Phycisphaerales bacterium]